MWLPHRRSLREQNICSQSLYLRCEQRLNKSISSSMSAAASECNSYSSLLHSLRTALVVPLLNCKPLGCIPDIEVVSLETAGQRLGLTKVASAWHSLTST